VGIVAHLADVLDGDVGRQQAVELLAQPACEGLGLCRHAVVGHIQVSHHHAGMHTGVRPAGSYHRRRHTQQGSQCLLKGLLHRRGIGLRLPAAVAGAVVG
jgi:hypothetical protein